MTDATEARRKLRERLDCFSGAPDDANGLTLSNIHGQVYSRLTVGDLRALAAEPSPAPLPADVEQTVCDLERIAAISPINAPGCNRAIALIRAQAAEIAALRPKAAAFDRLEGGLLAECLLDLVNNVLSKNCTNASCADVAAAIIARAMAEEVTE